MAEVTAGTGERPAEQQDGKPSQFTAQFTPDQIKQYAQGELNRLVKEQKLTFGKEATERIGTLESQLQTATEKITGLEQFLQQLNEPESPVGDLTPEQELQQLLRNRPSWVRNQRDQELHEATVRKEVTSRHSLHSLTRGFDELKNELVSERAALRKAEDERKQLEALRREADKKALLLGIAGDPEVNAVDGEAVRRYFWDDVVWDDKLGRHFFRDPEGNLVDTKTGVRSSFPDFLRKPASQAGGSGSGGSRAASPESELKTAREAAEAAETVARRTQSSQHILEYQRAKKHLQVLERKVAQAA